MRDPNRKEIREILQKLADDKAHTTTDLFPGVEGDAIIEPCEIVVCLGQLGYVTHEPPVDTGIDKVVRALWGIRITPHGHGWLKQDETIHRYANRLFVDRAEQISKEHEKREIAIRADFGRRGMIQSGGYFSSLAQAGLERIEALAQAKVDSILEAYQKAGVLIDRSVIEQVASEISAQCKSGASSLTEKLANTAKRINFAVSGSQDALGGPVKRKVESIAASINRKLEIKLDEVTLQINQPDTRMPVNPEVVEWDAFISYASEDEDFVGPLVQRLQSTGLRVWFFPVAIKVGDSLRRSIDQGLAKSRYGIVVLSPAFFAKKWPQLELDGLLAKETEVEKVILPVWHNVDREYVLRFSPTLAGRFAANSAEGLENVVRKLLDAIGPGPQN